MVVVAKKSALPSETCGYVPIFTVTNQATVDYSACTYE